MSAVVVLACVLVVVVVAVAAAAEAYIDVAIHAAMSFTVVES